MKQQPSGERILGLIRQSRSRLTVTDVLGAATGMGIHRKEARHGLKELMESGELIYRSEHGHIFVEESFDRPVQLSTRVTVVPEGIPAGSGREGIVVTLRHGASFGTGRHPSTRLAVRALDDLFSMPGFPGRDSGGSRMLDIGTGSGILAIAALQLGISRAVGLDTDACARFEAAENALINRVSDRFCITEAAIETISGPFLLITANLRYPTLSGMVTDIDRLTGPGSFVVFSGLKCEETTDLFQEYRGAGFDCLWKARESGWAAGLLRKHP